MQRSNTKFSTGIATCTELGLAANSKSLTQLRGFHGMAAAPLEAPIEASLEPDKQVREELAQSKPRRHAEK